MTGVIRGRGSGADIDVDTGVDEVDSRQVADRECGPWGVGF